MKESPSIKSRSRRDSSIRRNQFDESKIKMSLDYIFGRNISKRINFSTFSYIHSRKTGRLKQIEMPPNGRVQFTFRPNGTIAPTVSGAQFLTSGKSNPKLRNTVTVIDGVSEVVGGGKTVFCKHVVSCSDSLRAGEDIVIINEKRKLLAVGRAVLNGPAMKQFKRGQAVKVREGSQ